MVKLIVSVALLFISSVAYASQGPDDKDLYLRDAVRFALRKNDRDTARDLYLKIDDDLIAGSLRAELNRAGIDPRGLTRWSSLRDNAALANEAARIYAKHQAIPQQLANVAEATPEARNLLQHLAQAPYPQA